MKLHIESIKTHHPLIFRANESLNLNVDFLKLLDSLEDSIKDQNKYKTLTQLKQLVPEWKSIF